MNRKPYREMEQKTYRGGFVPFGYRLTDSGDLVEVEVEQKTIARIVALYKEGLSYGGIAAVLEAEGFSSRQDGVFGGQQILSILKTQGVYLQGRKPRVRLVDLQRKALRHIGFVSAYCGFVSA